MKNKSGLSSAIKSVLRDKSGKTYFSKISTPKSIIREAQALQLFKKISNTIKIPNLIKTNDTLLHTEYISNLKELGNISVSEQIKHVMAVLLSTDTLHTTNQHVAGLYLRPAWLQILILPIFLFNVAFKYSQTSLTLIKCIKKYYKYIPALLLLETKYVHHGDLNFTNIYKQNNKTVLLDFAESCVSHRYYSMAQALNTNWQNPKYYSLLYAEIIKTFKLTKKEQNYLNFFAFYNLLSRMQTLVLSTDKLKHYLLLLNHYAS